jgi:hypothetical protein
MAAHHPLGNKKTTTTTTTTTTVDMKCLRVVVEVIADAPEGRHIVNNKTRVVAILGITPATPKPMEAQVTAKRMGVAVQGEVGTPVAVQAGHRRVVLPCHSNNRRIIKCWVSRRLHQMPKFARLISSEH